MAATGEDSAVSARAARPWWKDVVCYQIWPCSFKDSNNDGKGDIQGIISKLDYLKELGIDVLWICPMYKSPMKDYGYDISDWQDINPDFGTVADMEQLIRESHIRGMKILMDLVVTHTSDQHPWFKESRSSRDNAKADWYIWRDRRPGNKIRNMSGDEELVEAPNNWRAAFGGSAWFTAPERNQDYIHLFLYEEPDLNWENPDTRKAIYKSAIKFWLDRDIDGFRIDTVNRLSKQQDFLDAPVTVKGPWQPGSQYYINGPRAHFFLQEMRAYMDKHARGKELMLVGELPSTPKWDVLRYVRPENKELSMVFDFDMVKLGGHDNPDEVKAHNVKNLEDGHASFTLPLFKDQLAKVQSMICEGAWGTVFMENHDQPRSINRYATSDPKHHVRCAKLLCVLQTTLSGTQFIYQGQEIGMLDMPSSWSYLQFRDPAARIYMEDELSIGLQESGGDSQAAILAYEQARIGNLKFGRDNGRTPMQWTNGPNAGFCDDGVQTWIGVNPNYKEINVAQQQEDQNSIWRFWKKQIALRKKYRETLMHGAFECWDHDNEKTFTYTKTSADGKSTLIVALNFSGEEQPIHLPQEMLKDLRPKWIVGNTDKPERIQQPLRAWEARIYELSGRRGSLKRQKAREGLRTASLESEKKLEKGRGS